MQLTSLTEIDRAIRSAWSVWTADPVDQTAWSPSNPARGQCAVTALVIQDLLGGELLLADVTHADGTPQGVHFSNRLDGGAELDLTREQFTAAEVVGEGQVIARPTDLTRGRLPGNYRLLAERVRRELRTSADPARPVTIKAVCTLADGRVLLCRNHRQEWELPGGRPERGESFAATLGRELAEETGLTGEVDRLIGLEALEVTPGRWIDVVGFSCRLPAEAGDQASATSDEHTAVEFLDPASVPVAELPAAYRRLVAASAAVGAFQPLP